MKFYEDQITDRIQEGYYDDPKPYKDYTKKSWEKRRKAEQEGVNRFEADCATCFDVKDYPSRQIIFDTAWSDGHSSGFHEILVHYEEMAKIARVAAGGK